MDPRDLYQQVILDHNQRPKNFKKLPDATHTAVGFNPLCGDKIAVFLDVVNGVIRDVGFQGMGCAISNASASMMTAAVKGKTVA
ncbi:MAG: Fe-S cluster assembly sulfur transfer protein SufU, partial [Gemmatimonadales bacterium]